MNVSIIGTGYVGLVSGVCLAEKGHRVVCVDVDESKVASINHGIPTIHEVGLAELLARHAGDRLRATNDLRTAVLESDITLISVGTPFDGIEIDLRYIRAVAEQIGRVLREKRGYHVVVVKSTVVPGTTEEIVLPLLEDVSGKRAGVDFGVGMNPEFLKEGEAVSDFLFPDRIVIGGIDARTIAELERLYQEFDKVQIIRTRPKTAEMIKYTANALLATLISFSNEVANLCGKVGVDIVDVFEGVHLDKRLNPVLPDGKRCSPPFLAYLQAGCGFGGSCFPKDLRAIVAYGTGADSPMQLLRAVVEVNDAQPEKMLELLRRHHPRFHGIKVAVLGVAFKPGTDDIRESPAVGVIRSLLCEGALARVFDPVARAEAEKMFGTEVEFCSELSEAIDGVSAVLLMTRWKHFERLPHLLSTMPEPPVVIDGRRMFDKTSVAKYEGIGL